MNADESAQVPIRHYLDQMIASTRNLLEAEIARVRELALAKIAAHEQLTEEQKVANLLELNRIVEHLAVIDAQIAAQLPREFYEQQHTTLTTRVDKLESWKNNVTGRLVVIGALGALAIGIFGAFIGHLIGAG